ncbi:hypothetical protein SAMN05660831_02209 [Thiohalospira halophila DSM 15071]|uniref:Uncharacterized protein n=1 Tax=Thiohalospira halophila DSM 15071 TaxID=1123397 RepID=A0A1I1UUI2_9GAMM|nr:DUF6776 family protein [Thiohalospira halophila]SFD74339.1 hypothetical protein SAMN05660831_02209 [Thiohalospira halophila DSM 15071]
MSHRVIVRPQRPRNWRFLLAALILAVAAGLWGIYELGRYQGGFDAAEARAERQRLLEAREALQERVEELRSQKVALERARDIEEQGHEQVREDLKRLQDELLEIKEELAFYRGIVSPEDTASGLRVQSFDVEKNASDDLFHYQLVLTQVLKNDSFTSGYASLEVEGVHEDGGSRERLDLAEISADETEQLRFRFRYFQDFRGDLELPEGFVPFRVIVTVHPSGGRYGTIEETFDWPVGSLIELENL